VCGRGADFHYIAICIGKDLARAVKFAVPLQKVRLMFGTGEDAGKIAVAADEAGRFEARAQKNGSYTLSVNPASAEGLFRLDFPAFKEERCEALRPENGQPPKFIFKASAEMLAVED